VESTAAYTQFATWAADAICCRWPLYGCLKRVRLPFADAIERATKKAGPATPNPLS